MAEYMFPNVAYRATWDKALKKSSFNYFQRSIDIKLNQIHFSKVTKLSNLKIMGKNLHSFSSNPAAPKVTIRINLRLHFVTNLSKMKSCKENKNERTYTNRFVTCY